MGANISKENLLLNKLLEEILTGKDVNITLSNFLFEEYNCFGNPSRKFFVVGDALQIIINGTVYTYSLLDTSQSLEATRDDFNRRLSRNFGNGMAYAKSKTKLLTKKDMMAAELSFIMKHRYITYLLNSPTLPSELKVAQNITFHYQPCLAMNISYLKDYDEIKRKGELNTLVNKLIPITSKLYLEYDGSDYNFIYFKISTKATVKDLHTIYTGIYSE